MISPGVKQSAKEIWKKFKGQIIAAFCVLFLSVSLSVSKSFLKEPPAPSIAEMIPQGFVLIPLDIVNGDDLISLMGDRGVVDLYSYSESAARPQEIAAKALKILLSYSQDEMRFLALAPENEAPLFLERAGPFYAVLQNPGKTGSQIYKKKKPPRRLRLLSAPESAEDG